MDGAALSLLISAVGVTFGWQPMPDGSQRYEYIVQVEPELAKTLADGQSIPIAADIPAEVQPIGRVRLVVGRNELPRQRLVTHLKPLGDGSTGKESSVQLAQYDRYADQRYSPAPTPQQPPATAGAALASGSNPYAQGQSPAAAPQAGGTSWNNDQNDPPITPTETTPPSGQQLFGQSAGAANSWNAEQAVESVASAASESISKLGGELQRGAGGVLQQGIQRVDNEVRGAADAFGDRTRNIVNELRQPFQQPQLPADSRPSAAAAGGDGAHSWNQAPPASGQTPPAQPSSGSVDWNHAASAIPAADSRTGASTASQHQGQQQPARGGDPWAGVPDPRPQTGSTGNAAPPPNNVPGMATRPLPFGGLGTNAATTGPEFPGTHASAQPPATGAAATPGGSSSPATGAPPVTIGSHLLNQPADRPLDGTTPQTAATPTPAGPAAGQTAATSQWGGGASTAATTATPAGASQPAGSSSPTGPTPSSAGNAAAVLVAWVLLSGSIAGNLYLFWSYLDVRQKYRSLVRKTARAVGSRFSAA